MTALKPGDNGTLASYSPKMKRQAIVLSIIELLSKQTHKETGNSVKAAGLSCNSGGSLGLET